MSGKQHKIYIYRERRIYVCVYGIGIYGFGHPFHEINPPIVPLAGLIQGCECGLAVSYTCIGCSVDAYDIYNKTPLFLVRAKFVIHLDQ